MQRIGCLTPLGLTAATLALLATVVMGFVSGGTMFSPGGLNAENEYGMTLGDVSSHAETRGDCARCHPEPWSSQTMAARCLACHPNVQAELRDPKTLHSAFADVSNCRDCHTEHRGAQAEITRLDANFPHEKVGFVLTRHQKLADGNPFKCADCHTKSIATFDRAQCETCHRDPTGTFSLKPTFAAHIGDFGNDCLACHDGADRFTQFDHKTLAFALTGKHTSAKCSECHVNARAIADLKKVSQTCVDCHRKDDKHKNAYGTDCAKCHTAEDWKKANFDHNLAAFKLTGKHTTVECAKCHVNNVFKGTPQTCVACHPDPDKHRGQFGADCAQCHKTDTWKGATFKHTFPLNHGESGTIACATCHTTPNNYKAYTCYGCHEHDPAKIERKHLKERITKFDDCARCHPTGRENEGKRD